LRPELPDLIRQIADDVVQILPVQIAVGIIQHNPLGHFQYLASGRKFFPSHRRQFVVRLGSAAIGSRLPGSKTYHASFHPAIMVKTKRASETSGFIIRMRRNHHHAKHGFDSKRVLTLGGFLSAL
jgi:hypothetical protein